LARCWCGAIEDRSHLAIETIIGVVFSAALAVGSLIHHRRRSDRSAVWRRRCAVGRRSGVRPRHAGAVTVFVLRRRHALVIALVVAGHRPDDWHRRQAAEFVVLWQCLL
jgi:hypothetical protein